MKRLRALLLEWFVPHGPGDAWGVAERLLGVILVILGLALAVSWMMSGCTVVTVNGGPGSIESDKAVILVKPDPKKERKE